MEIEPIEEGYYYHIYNRGINGTDIFKEKRNYDYFLNQYSKFVGPIANTFAYCLLRNHFHFLVQIKERENPDRVPNPVGVKNIKPLNPSRQFGNLFNSYAQSFNKAYGRTGGLFERPFKRKRITSDEYFIHLIYYIHYNPTHHGFVDDFYNYTYSSYKAIISEKKKEIELESVLHWFGDINNFIYVHKSKANFDKIEELIIETD